MIRARRCLRVFVPGPDSATQQQHSAEKEFYARFNSCYTFQPLRFTWCMKSRGRCAVCRVSITQAHTFYFPLSVFLVWFLVLKSKDSEWKEGEKKTRTIVANLNLAYERHVLKIATWDPQPHANHNIFAKTIQSRTILREFSLHEKWNKPFQYTLELLYSYILKCVCVLW